MSSPAVKASPRDAVRALGRRIPRTFTVPAPTTEAGLALGLAAALAAIVFAAKGGLTLGRTTDVEIAVTLGGAAIAGAGALIAPTPRRAWGGPALGLVAALAAFTVLSIVWSVQPSDSWEEANRTLSYLAAFGAAMALARMTPRGSGWVISAVLLACLVTCLYALATKVFPGSLNHDEFYARLREPFGYWNAVGVMGALGVPPLLWLGTRREGGPLLRALAVPALGLVIFAVLLAFSRGALLAAALGAALWFTAVPRRLRGAAVLATALAGALVLMAWAFSQDALTKDGAALSARSSAGTTLGLLLVALLGLLLAAGLGIERLAQRRPLTPFERRRAGLAVLAALALVPVVGVGALAVSSRGLSGSVSKAWNDLTDPGKTPSNGPGRLTAAGSIRAKYWSDAWKIFEHEPLIGAGAGAFRTARTHYRIDSVAARHAHGYVVQTLADLGLAGLALSLAALAAWLIAAWRALGLEPRAPGWLYEALQRPPPPRRPALRARWLAHPATPERVALVTLACVVVVFGVHSAIDWTWVVPGTAITALACAGYLAARAPLGRLGESVAGPPWRTRLAIAAGLIGLALVVSWAIWQPQRSASADDAALAQLSKNHVDLAYVEVVKARHRNPLSVDPLFNQATIEDSVGRRQAARAAYVRAVRLQPANAETWQRLGVYDLMALSRPRAAVDELRAALYLDPRSPEIQQQFLAAQRALNATQQAQRAAAGAAGTRARPAPSRRRRARSGATGAGAARSLAASTKPSQLRTPAQLRRGAAAPTTANTPKKVRTPKQVQPRRP